MDLNIIDQQKLLKARKYTALKWRLYLEDTKGMLEVIPKIGGFTDTSFRDTCHNAMIAIENVLKDYLLDENYYNQEMERLLK